MPSLFVRVSRQRRRRYREIVSALTRHGLGAITAQLGLTWLVPFHRGLLRHARRDHPYRQAEHLRLALEELGTTAIKLGQIGSTRPDLLPPEVITELERLRDRVPPVPTDAIMKVVERELGCDPSDVFAEFDPVPLAAASIGQVHGATLADGAPVVVKVRKPGVADTVAADLTILADMAARATASGTTRGYNLAALADDFAWTLRRELDYIREARNADRLRSSLAGEPRVVVPRIHWPLTTEALLVMERVEGVRIGDVARLDAEGIDRPALARTSAELLMRQVFEIGFFHADPHPGNFLVLADGRIALLDFGMVGTVDEELRVALVGLLGATVRQDAGAMARAFEDLGILRSPSHRQAVRRDLQRMLEDYYGLSFEQFALSEYVSDLLAVVRHHRLQHPTELALLLKTIAMSEGLWRQLDPAFNASAVAERYVHAAAAEIVSPAALTRRLVRVMGDLAERVARDPGAVVRGSGPTQESATPLERSLAGLQRQVQTAASNVSTAVVAAAFILGLPILAVVSQPPGWRLMAPVWLVVGVLVATGLIVRLVVAGRRHRGD